MFLAVCTRNGFTLELWTTSTVQLEIEVQVVLNLASACWGSETSLDENSTHGSC